MPNPDSVTIMQEIDRLPAGWRTLVHEYGFQAVHAVREAGTDLPEAEDELWMQRSSRQAKWLATNYVTPRSFENV